MTLQAIDTRQGKSIALDRKRVFEEDGRWLVETYAGEAIAIRPLEPSSEGTYSLKGHFDTSHSIVVSQWHRHSGFRDRASQLGLGLVGIWFVLAVYRRVTKTRQSFRASSRQVLSL